jgi:hypothetical protein
MLIFLPLMPCLLISSCLVGAGGGGVPDMDELLWDVSKKQKMFLVSVCSSSFVIAIMFAIFVAKKR